MTKVKVNASDEEINSIRQELAKWDIEELILELNLIQSFLDYQNPENTRIGWVMLALANEELGKRNCLFCEV